MKKVIFFLLFSSLALAAQQESQIAIYFQVGGNEGSVASSYFRRELRSLGDVTFVDHPTDADFWITAIVTQDTMDSGKDMGYSISLVVLEDSILKDLFEGEDKALIEAFETFDLVAHWLWSSPQDSLRQRISEMVAKFDSEQLEKRR